MVRCDWSSDVCSSDLVDHEEVFEASDQDTKEEPSNIPSSSTTGNVYSSAMSTTAAALTLAGTATTGTQSQFMGFSRKGKGPSFPPYVPGGGGPSGSGSGGLPGGGPPGGGGGGLPGGGGAFPAAAPRVPAGGGGKLGGNPPRVFDRTRSKAVTERRVNSYYTVMTHVSK